MRADVCYYGGRTVGCCKSREFMVTVVAEVELQLVTDCWVDDMGYIMASWLGVNIADYAIIDLLKDTPTVLHIHFLKALKVDCTFAIHSCHHSCPPHLPLHKTI